MPEFIVGPENRLLCVAVESILEETVPSFSPIVFYGPSGSGKSHVALGLASVWSARFRRRPAFYTTALDFARELSDAIETHSLDDFRDRYCRTSLFILEDVHYLADKPLAQHELVTVLDAFEDDCRWVVVTASNAPGRLPGLTAPLASRLLGGLTVPLVRPGLDTRLEIVRRLAELRSLELEESSVQTFAECLEGTVPELFGALVRLEMSAQLEGKALDAPQIRRYLAQRGGASVPSLREIAQATARHFSLKLSELRSSSRRQAVVTARGVAMYLARTLTSLSFEEIGRYFGGRDHTTVSYGCSTTKRLLETEPAIREAVEQLQQRWPMA